MELDLSLLEPYYGNQVKFKPIPKYPVEKRDLALVMDKGITCEMVEEAIRGANRYITDVALFDVYEGSSIPENKKSMAFTVTFTPKEEELNGEKLDSFVGKILKSLKKTLDIDLRE
jgi:phenylalanyl-tRNA synthetase beta chain